MSETKGGPNPNVGVLLEQKLLKQNHAEPVGKQRCVAETASTWSEFRSQNWRNSIIQIK